MYDVNNFTNRFNTVQDNGSPMVINVKFHGVHETNGTDSHNINEERFLKIIASINQNFNQFNIFFKYRGYDIINDSNKVNDYFPNWVDFVTQQGNYDENAINIMINNGGGFGTGIGSNAITMTTLSSFPNSINGVSTFYDYETNILMGWKLGLFTINTFSYQNADPVTTNIPPCISTPFIYKAYLMNDVNFHPENVARSGINFNADTAGDMVADTQACFTGFTKNYCDDSGLIYQNFMQHPDVIDLTSTMYNCTAVESHNFMQDGFLSGNGQPNSFTPGQGARMRQFIISNPNYYNSVLNLLANGDADVAPLFEPYYSQTYPTNEIISLTDNGDGTAKVCRSVGVEHRFQPGFDYTFSENTATDPITVSKSDFPVPPVQLHTFDYPVTIAQLNPATCNVVSDTGIAHISCTRMLICADEPYNGGKIISTDNLLNSIYTIEELDAIKVKDPQLYEKLMGQRYYKIIKETTTGVKTEEVFYKP
jgi:hypothetical protein